MSVTMVEVVRAPKSRVTLVRIVAKLKENINANIKNVLFASTYFLPT